MMRAFETGLVLGPFPCRVSDDPPNPTFDAPRFRFLLLHQPPLEFFLRAMGTHKWDDVTILTSLGSPAAPNPTYSALEALNGAGVLGSNVRLFHVSEPGNLGELVQ